MRVHHSRLVIIYSASGSAGAGASGASFINIRYSWPIIAPESTTVSSE